MSLKAIKDVLDAVKHWECADGATNAQCAHCRRVDALKDVAALEKAAKVIKRMTIAVPQDLLTTDEAEAIETMCTIAKETE